MEILESAEINDFFKKCGYVIEKPHEVANNKDTIFISAGIQPLLKKYRDGLLTANTNFFISQPVIRTQFINSLDEGTSLAFVNITSSSFNNSEAEHNKMIKDWYEFLYNVGLQKSKFSIQSDIYEKNWGDLIVHGKRIFHYYDGLEIGDTTFFTKVLNESGKKVFESMSDLGFGLERIRWKKNDNSYYDLYSDSTHINSKVKAYLSAIALLAVNDIQPSNKNVGYRFRLFSKKLVNLLDGRSLYENERQYLVECIKYWMDWQQVTKSNNISIILNEYTRNGNRYIIDKLTEMGYENLFGININISREEFVKRLIGSGVENERVKILVR